MDEDMLWLIIGVIIAIFILFTIAFVVTRLPTFWQWRFR
jgi:hypothetical protein